jgi:hypothetical protein
MCRCVASAHVFLWGSFWACINMVPMCFVEMYFLRVCLSRVSEKCFCLVCRRCKTE